MFDYLFWCLLVAPILLLMVYVCYAHKEAKETEESLRILNWRYAELNHKYYVLSNEVFGVKQTLISVKELKEKEVAEPEQATSGNLHDAHYKKLKAEPWDIMEANMTHEEVVGFLKGNIQKYLHRNKEGLKDYEKLVNYGNKLVKVVKEHGKNSNNSK
ncbi:DUF3310 domain-containing protein [Veillonella intestinalis]|uniref:DUF3310 domain-containing protein n=1 Tax=Veillonella intestinalis TaxID=2941341 RepID=UPI00203E4105|nr:DUF3310 domain-containing protein [Veillonella intestinalis]